MEHNVRTVWAAYLQSCLTQRLNFSAMQYTTLNEKLGIQSGVAVPTGQYPVAQYFAIGNKGHTFELGTDGIALTKIYQHKATDAALFNQIPFVLRQENDDISPAERAKYALRKVVVVSGTNYVAYYLRRADTSGQTPTISTNQISNGNVTTTTLTATASNLSPTPVSTQAVGNANVTVLSGDYVTCSTPLQFNFSASDVSECLNACQILYGSDDYAIISEIAHCSGLDKTIVVSAATGNFNFNETIGVQVNNFIGASHVLKYLSAGFTRSLDIGSNSPLYNVVPA